MAFIDEKIADKKTIGIAGHVRPDGDSVGSSLALYNYITKNYPDKEVDVYIESFSESLKFLKGSDKIAKKHRKNEDGSYFSYDLFIATDVSAKDRLSGAEALFDAAKDTLNIDHHVSNPGIAAENIVKGDYSSACEVLFELLTREKIDKDIAECLYTGIIHDTGVFKYQATSKNTMEIAGFLMEKGINYQNIIDDSFYAKTYVQSRMVARCVLAGRLAAGGRCIYSIITKEMMDEEGATAGDLDSAVAELRLIEGIECAIVAYPLGENEHKISLRAKNYMDVAAIAGEFGGGGHVRAAGCTLYGDINEEIKKLLALVEKNI